MSAFFRTGDVILNPFDRRCARWDLLGEIERPGDHAFLAQSVLPHLGIGEYDQWITYAQQLLAAALENFNHLGLGTTNDLVAMLASGSVTELKLLCQGTAAARYFEPGGEKMLASILGTLAPAIGNLRFITTMEASLSRSDGGSDPARDRSGCPTRPIRSPPYVGLSRAG